MCKLWQGWSAANVVSSSRRTGSLVPPVGASCKITFRGRRKVGCSHCIGKAESSFDSTPLPRMQTWPKKTIGGGGGVEGLRLGGARSPQS